MNKYLLLFVFILMATPVFAQIQWQKYLGGSTTDDINDIHQTSDGGYIVAGSALSNDGDVTGNHGKYDAWIVKLSSSGGIEWQKCFGGTEYEVANSVQETSDGGFIFAGYTASLDGDVAGKHGSDPSTDFWVVKLSSTGALMWQKCIGGSSSEEAYSIQQTSDGGYVVAGSTTSTDGDVTAAYGQKDVWVVKLSNIGAIEWQKTFGGSKDDVQFAVSINQTFDGGYVFATTSNSADGNITTHHGGTDKSDFWIVKLSAIGSIEWQESLGGSSDDEAYSIRQTFDSGFVVTGSTYSSDGDVTGHISIGPTSQDIWVVKLRTDGSVNWNRCVDVSTLEAGHSIQQTSDTGYIICGQSYNYFTNIIYSLLVKLSASGAAEWTVGLRGGTADIGHSVSQTKDGGYAVCGYTYSGVVSAGYHGGSDGWVIKMGSKPSGVDEIANTQAITVTPNPVLNELSINSTVTITEISIMDLTGQTVYQQKYHTCEVRVNVADFTDGVYLLKINNTEVRRFVKQ